MAHRWKLREARSVTTVEPRRGQEIVRKAAGPQRMGALFGIGPQHWSGRGRAQVVCRLEQPGVGPPAVGEHDHRGVLQPVPQLVVGQPRLDPHGDCRAIRQGEQPPRPTRVDHGVAQVDVDTADLRGGIGDALDQVDVEVRPHRRCMDVRAATRRRCRPSPGDVGQCDDVRMTDDARTAAVTRRNGVCGPPGQGQQGIGMPHDRRQLLVEAGLVREVRVVQVVHGVHQSDTTPSEVVRPRTQFVGGTRLEAEVEVHDVHAGGSDSRNIPDVKFLDVRRRARG